MSTDTLQAPLMERLQAYVQHSASGAQESLRLAALAQYEALGLPHPDLEDWKYTNFKGLKALDPSMPLPILDESTIDISQYRIAGIDAIELVFVNGRFAGSLSRPFESEQLYISTLAKARNLRPDLLEAHLGKYAQQATEGLTALNLALANDGFVIHLTKNEVCDRPVVVYHLSTGTQERGFNNLRNLVVAEAGSKLVLIEKYISNSPIFDNIVTEVVVGANADVEHYRLQTRYGDAWQVGTTRVEQGRDSRYYNATISWSGQMVRNNLQARHAEKNCETHFFGLYLLDHDNLIDNHTLMDHAMPNCYSHELYKGIVGPEGKAVFNGKVLVRPDAQKTNAYQSNANILLADTGTVNAKPELEIFADDVKCSHGATVGQLDLNELFYLKSRGIGEEKARTILLTAFAGEVVEAVRIEALRDDLMAQLMEELQRMQISFE
ncbi:MAG: Fe-S cluster assembly protein SufD [Sphingobacteriaceae bacterium]|nr:Fe-S cluster assembly protein SufD [Sphingobacteriaceae bacterium]